MQSSQPSNQPASQPNRARKGVRRNEKTKQMHTSENESNPINGSVITRRPPNRERRGPTQKKNTPQAECCIRVGPCPLHGAVAFHLAPRTTARPRSTVHVDRRIGSCSSTRCFGPGPETALLNLGRAGPAAWLATRPPPRPPFVSGGDRRVEATGHTIHSLHPPPRLLARAVIFGP